MSDQQIDTNKGSSSTFEQLLLMMVAMAAIPAAAITAWRGEWEGFAAMVVVGVVSGLYLVVLRMPIDDIATGGDPASGV